MKEIAVSQSELTFKDYDTYREAIGAEVFSQLLAQFFVEGRDCIVSVHAKARLAEEAVEWTDCYLAAFHRDRLEAEPSTRINLRQEIRDSKEVLR